MDAGLIKGEDFGRGCLRHQGGRDVLGDEVGPVPERPRRA